MYLTRVLLRLDPSLYPHSRAFVVEPLRLSLFEPLLAAMASFGLPLMAALLLLHLATLGLTLRAGLAVLRRVTPDPWAQLSGVALLAAWSAMPVAATSLMLVDPYLTARSFAAPCTLFAIAFALDNWTGSGRRRAALSCAVALALGFAFHPLMAGYAAALVVMLRLARSARPVAGMLAAALLALAGAAALQFTAHPSTHAVLVAEASRYYWFLSQWHWYELLGIAGPAAIFAALAASPADRLRLRSRTLARAVLALMAIAVLVALGFAQERFPAHPVARLQPLRVLWSVYALLPLLLGAALARGARWAASRMKSPFRAALLRGVPAALVAASGVAFFAAARANFPASPHLEWPGRDNANPWVLAFLWARENTPRDALVALDARYVNLDGEDAQNFRALSLRSSLPDFSKDGGEAAIEPALAADWLPVAEAQRGLSEFAPDARRARLAPFHADWMVLRSAAPVDTPCPFDNGVVKVCHVAR